MSINVEAERLVANSMIQDGSAGDGTSHFSKCYQSVTSASLSKEEYCLQLAHDAHWHNVAVTISNNSVALLKRETLEEVSTFEPHQQSITDLKYSQTNNNILWTSSSDGSIKIWDTRSNQCEKTFQGNTKKSTVLKPITSFDISNNERILCGGTEFVEEGAFILFWDIRGSEVLGSYWESINDDVTQIRFNPQQEDILATSSTDGLINIFDVSQNNEDDALTYCLNAEVAVNKLSWLSQGGRCERLAAVTGIETLQYWDIKEAAPLYKFTREAISSTMKCQNSEECYLVSVDAASDSDNPVVMSAYHTSEGGDCLRTLKLDIQTGHLKPHGSFLAKQQLLMVRTSLYQTESDTFITGGECGIVRLWRPEVNSVVGKESIAKVTKKHRKKPY